MIPLPPQPLTLGNAPLGHPPNIQTQLLFQQPGLTHLDFPPLPSPSLPPQTPVPTPPPSHQTLTPLVNPPHLRHDTPYAPHSKYDSDVEFCTDASDVENGKENTDEEKGTQQAHKHGWQHVKKRKKIHQSTELSTRINPDISTQNRYTPLLNRQETEEIPQTSTHRVAPNTPRPPPIFVY